jgi:hypothetical protein
VLLPNFAPKEFGLRFQKEARLQDAHDRTIGGIEITDPNAASLFQGVVRKGITIIPQQSKISTTCFFPSGHSIRI